MSSYVPPKIDLASHKRPMPDDLAEDLEKTHHVKCSAASRAFCPAHANVGDGHRVNTEITPPQIAPVDRSPHKRPWLVEDDIELDDDGNYPVDHRIGQDEESAGGIHFLKRPRPLCMRQLSHELSKVDISKDDYMEDADGAMAVSENLARMLEDKLGIQTSHLKRLPSDIKIMKQPADENDDYEQAPALDIGTNRIFFELSDELQQLLRADFKRRNLMQPEIRTDADVFQIAAANKMMPSPANMALVPYVPSLLQRLEELPRKSAEAAPEAPNTPNSESDVEFVNVE